jgi:hypothetical protein
MRFILIGKAKDVFKELKLMELFGSKVNTGHIYLN